MRNLVYNQNIFHPHRKPLPPHTCSQPDPSSPTSSTNVGAKHFSPESQPATPHTLFATRPVSHNTTNQCRGEIFFARIATSNTAYLFATRPAAPTPPINVGAKYFSPESQPATPHTRFATGPVTSNIICQRAGEKYFAPTTYYRSALSR